MARLQKSSGMVTFTGKRFADLHYKDEPDEVSVQIERVHKVMPVPPGPLRDMGWRSEIDAGDDRYASRESAADIVARINRGAHAEAEELKRIERTLVEILGHLKQNA